MSPQVVLHAMQRGGHFRCDTFVAHRAVHPQQVVVVAGNSTLTAELRAEELGDHLHRELVNLSGPPPPAPCGGGGPAPLGCMFTMRERLLVVVGDGSGPVSMPSWAAGWKTLAILPGSAQVQAATLLPPPLSASVASFWQHSIREVVADVLAAAGVTPEWPRIFISYKRSETQGLANQLFHALAAAQFDVFLDHYRIPAGVELLARIRQELADKTMVLLLESAQLLSSRWTRLEVRTAQALRLGLFGVTVPGGVPVPGLGGRRRALVTAADFSGGRFRRGAVLKAAPLKRLIAAVRTQHDRAAVERRRQITRSMQDALLLRGIHAQHFDAAGRLCVRGGSPARDYAVWLASRSPDLADFHRAGGSPVSSRRDVVVGIARCMERQRREQVEWLSRVAGIALRDEGRIDRTAAEIAAGTL